jgi:protocatechuate 3,4-dioxygenase beta subunit
MLPVLFALAAIAAQVGVVDPQVPPAPQADKPKADCVVKGQVLNSVTGEPLRKARVTLMKAEAQMTRRARDVDTAGRFEFRSVEPGRYTLSAERAGFVTQSYGSRKAGYRMGGTTVTLAPAQEMKDLVIKLSPQAVITGRVIDEDGEPMANVQVSAMKWMWQGKKQQLAPSGFASTNDLGEYRMFGLAPDSYLVQASRRELGGMPVAPEPSSEKPEDGYVATWYPSTLDVSTAPRVTVKGGTELRGVDIRMVKTRVVRIRGTIISSTTGKASTGNVMLMPRNKGNASWMDMKHTWVRTPADGFEFREITPGAYVIQAQTGSREEAETVQQNVDVGDSNIDNLVLRPTTGIEIRGKLTVEDGKTDGERLNVSLQPWDDEGTSGFGGGWGEVKDDGTFTMKNVQAGRYRVQCFKQGTYIKAARAGDQDVLNSPLDTTQGGPPSLEITLSGNGPQVAGSVKNADGKLLPGVSVVLIPDDESWRGQWAGYGTSTTDQYGNFRVTNLRPGEYKAIALEEVEGGEYMDPEFVKRYERKATPVSLKEGSKENLQLTLITVENVAVAEAQ